ncbi:MAG: hypothetical protein ABSD97_08920 [Acidimicrobiales bacterium]
MRHRGSSGPRAGRSAWRIAVWSLCTLGFFGLIWLLYLSSVHSLPPSSDSATVVLEGKALIGGNFTLNHWALSLDSFWLVDVPVYAVAVLVGGVHHQLMNLVPAIVAAVVVAVGAWIAYRGHTRWAGVIAAGTVVAILGLPTHALAGYFLLGPLHVTTTLWCLLAFVALRRGRFGWGWLAAVVLGRHLHYRRGQPAGAIPADDPERPSRRDLRGSVGRRGVRHLWPAGGVSGTPDSARGGVGPWRACRHLWGGLDRLVARGW